MNDIRMNIKTFLRDRLVGKENLETKNRFMKELKFSNENIKSYTNMSRVIIPPVETFEGICKFFNVTLYEFLGIKDPSQLTPLDRERLRKINENPTLADIIDNYKK